MSGRALSPSIHSHSHSLLASCPFLPRPNLLFCRSSFGVTLSLSRALKWPRRVTSFFGPDSDRAAAYIFLVIC